MTDAIATAAAALIEAHKTKTLIPSSQAIALADLAAGFEVQARVTKGLGATLAGWKVPKSPEGIRVAAPFYQHACVPSGSLFDLRRGGIDWRKLDFRKLRCVAKVDGKVVFDQVDSHPQKDPLASLVEYASIQADRLGGLRAGQIVTTGSMSGVTRIDRPVEISGEISEIGNVSVRVVAV